MADSFYAQVDPYGTEEVDSEYAARRHRVQNNTMISNEIAACSGRKDSDASTITQSVQILS